MSDIQQYPQSGAGESPDVESVLRDARRPLERFVGSRIGVIADVEDIVAEATLQTYEYIQRSEVQVVEIRALLFKIARNRIADYYERRRTHPEVSIDNDEAPIVIPTPGSLGGTVAARIELQDVGAALGALREEYREVIRLHAIVGLTTREVAELMDKPDVNVRVLLYRARRALRKELRRQGKQPYDESEVDQS